MNLADLIASGKLPVRTKLHHPTRIHHDRAVDAIVVKEGIRLRGRAYDTPSGAAKTLTGRSVDGWSFWYLPNGDRLDSLRPARVD